jgi:serine/threonine protein phosphatase PrpC
VGGLPGGGEAAQAAHDSILAGCRALPPGSGPNLLRMVGEANAAVVELGRLISPVAGIATTLTFGVIFAGALRLVHLGDSRCYAWKNGRLQRLTEDHTVANEARRLRLRGEAVTYSPAEGRAITRCLGCSPAPEPELIAHPLASGERYLFCTDGVTGLVSDVELAQRLGRAPDPGACLGAILALVEERGAHDNATGVAVFVDEI